MNIVIIGGRGNGTVVLSAIEDCKEAFPKVRCIGFLNDYEEEINGYPVLAPITEEGWKSLDPDWFFIYTLSNIKQAFERHQKLKKLKIPVGRFATIIHPTASVSNRAELGIGVVLMPYVSVGPDVMIGNHSQMYAHSFIGHDSLMEEMVFVSNNATIGGRIRVKNGAHIGSNSSIRERLVIGSYAVVGLGAVVIRDVLPFAMVAGNPARVIGTLR